MLKEIWYLAAALAIASPVGLARADEARKAQQSHPALTVSVALPSEAPFATRVSADGTVRAVEEVSVRAETGGLRIVESSPGEGDRVVKGQVLARLDDSLIAAQMRQQEAALAEAVANHEAAVTAVERAGSLYESKTTTRQALDDKVSSLKTAKARMDQATAALEALGVQAARTGIVAPADGYLSKDSATVGNIAQSGDELFRLVRNGLLEVVAVVPENRLHLVKAGNAARIEVPSGETLGGTVRLVGATVDPVTRMGEVHVTIIGGTGVRPGMFAAVSITAEESRLLSVSERALVWHGGKPTVFVEQGGSVRRVEIEIGPRGDGAVAVVKGLASDDRVVVNGAGLLNDGDFVAVAATERGQ